MHPILNSIIFGLIIVVTGTLSANLIKYFNFDNNSNEQCKDWNKYHIMEITLFITGVVAFLFSYKVGLLKFYCNSI